MRPDFKEEISGQPHSGNDMIVTATFSQLCGYISGQKLKHENKKTMKFSEVRGWVSMRTVHKTVKP